MRLRQYINEGIIKPTKEEVKEAISLIYKKCMPFISDLKKQRWSYISRSDQLLLSGRKGNDDIIYRTVRKDRVPLNTDEDDHRVYDDAFYKVFGYRGRSNALFCSGDISQARYNDTIYMIFPEGKYNILWSGVIRDLYMSYEFRELKMKYSDKTFEDKIDYFKKDAYIDELITLIKKYYQTGNIVQALRAKKEVMLITKKYVGIEYEKYQTIIKMYIEVGGTKYDDKLFDDFWIRYGGL